MYFVFTLYIMVNVMVSFGGQSINDVFQFLETQRQDFRLLISDCSPFMVLIGKMGNYVT